MRRAAFLVVLAFTLVAGDPARAALPDVLPDPEVRFAWSGDGLVLVTLDARVARASTVRVAFSGGRTRLDPATQCGEFVEEHRSRHFAMERRTGRRWRVVVRKGDRGWREVRRAVRDEVTRYSFRSCNREGCRSQVRAAASCS